jgi:hypothetical protein
MRWWQHFQPAALSAQQTTIAEGNAEAVLFGRNDSLDLQSILGGIKKNFTLAISVLITDTLLCRE